jgi:TIR domain
MALIKADRGIPSVMLPTEPFRPILSRLWKTRQTPMADIFISYASVDRPFARRLADALEALGWEVWWDHRSLRVGQFTSLSPGALADSERRSDSQAARDGAKSPQDGTCSSSIWEITVKGLQSSTREGTL